VTAIGSRRPLARGGDLSSEATLPFGPIQMLVISSERTTFTGKVLPELRRLSDEGLVRLVDLLFVAKRGGQIESVQATELSTEEAEEFGALVGALIGVGFAGEDGALAGAAAGAAELEDGHVFDEDEVWYLADTIPEDGWAAVALIEHRWAIPLRDAIVAAGGVALADEWIHPSDLIAVGAELHERYAPPAG
jgi:uncharacterized membrane protein